MANRVPTLLATAVAAACSLSAHANGPTQADFSKVVLYADVTIAQDSASQWGIWEQLEPTAAGPQTPLPLIGGATEMYRPLGNVTTPTTPTTPTAPVVAACSSGALCGFGVMAMSTYSWNQDQLADRAVIMEGESNDLRVGFKLLPTTQTTPAWLPESMQVSAEPIRTDASETVSGFSVQGTLIFDGFNSHDYASSMDSVPPAGVAGLYESVSIETDLESAPSGSQAGRFQGGVQIVRYVSGGVDREPLSGTAMEGEWYGVWGLTTSAADMNNLRLSNAEASYSGYTFNGAGKNTGSVQMSVNFGTSTFKADFNGGAGVANPLASGSLQKTPSGSVQINGALSFSAAGTISGSQFSSNALSIGGFNAINGKVEGAFFGPNAAVAGGAVDVHAVVAAPGSSTPVYARYAAPFIAIKGEPKGVGNEK